MFLGMTQLDERKGNNLMQRKGEPLGAVTAGGRDFQNFMLPVNSLELKELLSQYKYSGREPRNSVELDDIIKGRDDKKIENSRKALLFFIVLSVLLLIGIGLLPISPVPVSAELTVTSVSVPESASSSSYTQLFTVIETHTD